MSILDPFESVVVNLQTLISCVSVNKQYMLLVMRKS